MHPLHYRNIPANQQAYEAQIAQDVNETSKPVYIDNKDVYSLPVVPHKETEIVTSAPIAIPAKKTTEQWNICFFGD